MLLPTSGSQALDEGRMFPAGQALVHDLDDAVRLPSQKRRAGDPQAGENARTVNALAVGR
jgi:hypothetical protein